jgi:DNA-binding PadR family transcriptional regulator
MGRVDLFVLKVISDLTKEEEKLTLANIVQKIQALELEEPPARTAIYQRLSIMIKKELVNFEWEEGKKLYKITENGMKKFLEVKLTLGI